MICGMAVISSVKFEMIIYFVSFYLTFSVAYSQKELGAGDDHVLLNPNKQYVKSDTESFKIYCYPSVSKSIFSIWRSVYLTLDSTPVSYDLFPGLNSSEVSERYGLKSRWSPSSWFSEQKASVDFPAFSSYCVGIASKEQYALTLNVRTINYWRLLQTIIGVLLFLSAPSLSRNSFFHYTSGVSVGVIASFLILIFVISRFIPKKSASYAVLVFGYSFILYIIQFIWNDLSIIISNHIDIVLIYSLITAFISFLVCYRLGPVQNVRTFKIIQWIMQILAVILIYLSSEYREVSTAIILILITALAIPASWFAKIHSFWLRFFPPKVKLLTELEYIEQGHVETKKALEDLRRYCSSPDCNTWKTVSRLQNPLRFAEFIEQGKHCTDQELLQYNSECFDFDDDEDESDIVETSNSYSSSRLNGHSR